jgi:hypothetical protein
MAQGLMRLELRQIMARAAGVGVQKRVKRAVLYITRQ